MRALRIYSRFVINLFFVWPFKLFRWLFRKIFKRKDEEDFLEEEEENYMDGVLDRAIVYATEMHEGQYRKGTNIPYILHPLEVASIVATMTEDEDILAAAVLHDVLEDTDSCIEDIADIFGDAVAFLVSSETENKRATLPAADTWKIRKREKLDYLEAAPIEVKMITLGDKLSNIRAIHRDYGTIGDDLWNRFNQKDKDEHHWYYRSVADCLSELCEYSAYKEYTELVEKTFGELTTQTYKFKEVSHNEESALKKLWHSGTKEEWQRALNGYYYMLRPEQREIEDYIGRVDPDKIRNLDAQGFYEFLYQKYFLWKFTDKRFLLSNRRRLNIYIEDNDLSTLKKIQNEIFDAPKYDIGKCLDIASRIHGLATAGASGLLAILFPEYFGTVDQFVAKRLQEVDHPIYACDLMKINPQSLKNTDGVLLIKIMREKANELNKKFSTDFWTPRRIDMVLWSFGR